MHYILPVFLLYVTMCSIVHMRGRQVGPLSFSEFAQCLTRGEVDGLENDLVHAFALSLSNKALRVKRASAIMTGSEVVRFTQQ